MTLPAHVEAAVIAHARKSSPAECCGLLLGNPAGLKPGPSSSISQLRNSEYEIVEAIPTRNTADDPVRRYLVDPHEYFQTIRRARQRTLEVIGVYHSHPRSSAMPSPTDRAEGFGHFVFLIVGLAADPPEVSAWTWADGNFAPQPLVRFT